MLKYLPVKRALRSVVCRLPFCVRVRKLSIVCAMASLFLTVTIMWCSNGKLGKKGETLEYGGYLVNTKGCVIPAMNPFDPSISWLFSPKSDLTCKGPQPLVTVDYERRTIKMDSALSELYYKERAFALSCNVRTLWRPKDEQSDSRIVMDKYGQSLRLTEMEVTSEFIRIQCKNGSGQEVYTDFVPFIQKKQAVERRIHRHRLRTKYRTEKRLSVALMGIDSVSRLNFLRHFRRTHRYITETMLGLDYVGYTKVGDNTLPNLLAILTGKHIGEIWNGSNDGPFDGLNFIWKTFSSNGYRTLYAEDSPTVSAFNYMRKGFRKQPTDYYYRPFTIGTEWSTMAATSSAHCFNARMEVDVVLQWLHDFHRTFKDEALFSLTFTTRLTHDSLNWAGWADRPFYNFLQKAHSEGLFNNSILFFFSDHGMRFGSIRHTYIGKLEERLPFLFVMVPQWFSREYPHVWQTMQANQRRLTSPFDIYATMSGVINLAYVSHNGTTTGTTNQRGLSLLAPITETRTCEDAGISAHWCVCQVRTPVDVSHVNVMSAAGLLVGAMNDKLLRVRQLCAALELHEVLDARITSLNKEALHYTNHKIVNSKIDVQLSPVYDYLVTYKVSPSNGIFEGTVRFSNKTGEFMVMRYISRISKYGNESYCVNSAELQLFCYCLN